MFVSFSLWIYLFMMITLSINQQLLRFIFLDTNKIERLDKEYKKLKKKKEYDQLEYIKTIQSKKDINFELIYFTIGTLVVMFACLFMIERFDPLVIFGHRLGMFSIILLLIIEGYTVKVILNKLGVK